MQRLSSFALGLSALLSVGLATPDTADAKRPRHANNEESAMTQSITFEPGRVYEVTGIWVRPGQEEALGAYFGKVFPIAAERYGVKPLFSLQPVNVYSGDFEPQVMFVNEWPSLKHFQDFIADPDAKALFPERDAVTERLVVTQYQVPEKRTVELSDGDVVEFAAMWIQPGKEDALGAYYQQAFAIAKKHDIRPITGLAPVFSYSGDFMPGRAGLNLWGTLDNFLAFAEEAAPLFPQRDAVLDRLEVTHAAVRFEGGK